MLNLYSKQNIETEYRLAILDFMVARNEEEQWSARKAMARLERIAMEDYGFDYAKSLEILKDVLKD